ncbi:MAG TPA: flavin reductase family protein [Longimicrobiales bacterium]|jgi:3-hydroxy-9,10-secoandrosta-1,3,5(10)-triene-9,17-dione monooxygenase reductase component
MPDELHFRNVMSHLATGVTVVASRQRTGDPCGLTANAVASVSLDPPMILVCVDLGSRTLGCLRESGVFAISVLSAGEERVARRFAVEEPSLRFEGVSFRDEATGAPVLDSALAWLDCRVRDVHEAGDHAIVVGDVVACAARDGDPLLFFRGAYRTGIA